MARSSSIKNKTVYQLRREELGLSREKASELLEMLASLNSVQRRQERLIEITADGLIEEDELEDFLRIQDDLERISITVETLQLWAEQKLSSGDIDLEAYAAAREKRKK